MVLPTRVNLKVDVVKECASMSYLIMTCSTIIILIKIVCWRYMCVQQNFDYHSPNSGGYRIPMRGIPDARKARAKILSHAHSRHVSSKKRVAMWVNRPVYDRK